MRIAVGLCLSWSFVVCLYLRHKRKFAAIMLVALVGCGPEVDCVPEAAALPDTVMTEAVASGPSLNEREFSGRYLVLLDRSLGMRGFVRPGTSKNLFRPALSNLQRDLHAAGGTQIEFWGVSQENRDVAPLQLQLSEWQAYSAPSNCRPRNEFSPTDCPSVYSRFGRLEETVRQLDRGGHGQFRVAREDVAIIITDLQIDSSKPGDPGPLGDALKQLVAQGSAVGILGALSSFTGVIHDLPDAQRDVRSRVLDDRRQPFFFVVVGPREPVQRTIGQLEDRLRTEGAVHDDLGSMLFLLSAGRSLEHLHRRIRYERNSGAEAASPFFAHGSVPARHVQEGRILTFKLNRTKLRADLLSPLVTVRIEPEANRQSPVATAYRLVAPPEAQPLLWVASAQRGRGNDSCKVTWQPLEQRLERIEVPAPDRNAAGIGVRLRGEGTTIPIAVKALYFLSWEVEVETRTVPLTPGWVRRWDVPFGQVQELHQAATLRTNRRDFLGVGNLAELVNRLTAAQVRQPREAGRFPVRVAFKLED